MSAAVNVVVALAIPLAVFALGAHAVAFAALGLCVGDLLRELRLSPSRYSRAVKSDTNPRR